MANTSTFYSGADYGLSYESEGFLGMKYRTPFSEISFATNPFTANQIQEVSNKLNTGARALEVNLAFVDQQGSPAESIPDEHLTELNRLKKLTGVDFTMHGALVEPTGMTGRGAWDESQRKQAERQLWVSLQKSKKLDPDGNIVVTFHSSNGLPEPETKVIDERSKEERTVGIQVIDELTGKAGMLPIEKHHFPTGDDEKEYPYKEIEKINEKIWRNSLQQTNYQAFQGADFVQSALNGEGIEGKKIDKEQILKAYEVYGTQEYQNIKKDFGEGNPASEILEAKMRALNRGSINLKDAYSTLKGLFDTAYSKTEQRLRSSDESEKRKAQEDMKKLQDYKSEIKPKVNDLESPEKIGEFSEEIIRGINILSSISVPKTYRPLREFAIDKASQTFSNLAVQAFDKYGDKAPVISIENPPAGSGLSRAEDLKDLIKETREKFVTEVTKKFDITESEAESQAKKLIGATWDLGHINMLRKYGYDEDEGKKVNLIQQTKTIAPYIKNVHLSDNFGMEHTELPMGMGNVPTKAHMDLINEYQKKVKKVVETGNWYQHFGKDAPVMQTVTAFGSGIFKGYGVGPNWTNAYGSATASGASGYFAGYGLNPDIHHSIYGAGFSGLPTELGGQIPGRNSRLSGTAME